jgi:hypothetical protein
MRNGECWERQTWERRTKETGSGSWPTPKASPSGPDFARIKREKSGGDDLATAVVKKEWFPTMTACEWKGRGPASKQQGLTNKIGCTGGQLNPMWVEWLMGWPLGWTDLQPLVMDKCQPAPPRLSAGLLKGSEVNAA